MRVISGYLRGRRFTPPNNLPVRPTTDLARESLFNILRNKIEFDEVNALDLFSGTGSISIELISRGCQQVTAVDLNFKCIEFIRKTATDFEIDNIQVIRSEVQGFIQRSRTQYDLIFADPPYDLPTLQEIPNWIFEKNMLKENGLLVMEHPQHTSFENHPRFEEHRNYGKVNFSFFK